MSFSENVRKLRRLMNLTQAQLAQKTKYSTHTINRIERGQWNGAPRVVIDLARFFGVKPEELDESIKGDISVPEAPITELPDLHSFNKAMIMETLKPLNGNDGVREAVASRLSGILDRRRFGENEKLLSHAEIKCRIMELIMNIQSMEILDEIISFIEFKRSSEKKIETQDHISDDAVYGNRKLKG